VSNLPTTRSLPFPVVPTPYVPTPLFQALRALPVRYHLAGFARSPWAAGNPRFGRSLALPRDCRPPRRPYALRPHDPTPLFALGTVKDFVEKPGPVFGFVDPVLDQTRGGDIVVLVAHLMRSAQVLNQPPVVRQQIG
jgi:hypothetical protein